MFIFVISYRDLRIKGSNALFCEIELLLLQSDYQCTRPRVRKSRYRWRSASVPHPLLYVTNSPYLFSGELCTSTLHCKRLLVYTVYRRPGGQCSSVLRTRHSDVILTWWGTVVGEVTSASGDTMCHS